MAITRFKNSSIANKGPKYDNALAGLPYIPIIGTATDGGNGTSVSVAFTGNNVAGAGVTYTALSTPGSITATGAASPITVTGLTSGTEYTFKVKAGNSLGDSAYSAASNSVTPVTPTAFESIATATPAAGTNNITFTSIPNTYQHLQLRCIVRGNWTGGAGPFTGFAAITFNSDTAANYADHRLSGDGSSAQASGGSSISSIGRSIAYSYGTSISTNTFAASILDIHDYANTSKFKTIREFGGSNFNTSSTEEIVNLSSGLWRSTSAINSINIYIQGGGFAGVTAGSTFALYGIR